jgi:peptidyl-prolyl cis-trans isomerase C
MDQFCSRHKSKLFVALVLSGVEIGALRAQTPKTPVTSPVAPASQAGLPSFESPEPPDKVVLKVGDQKFTKADMDALIDNLSPQVQRAVATQGKKSLGDQYAVVVELSQRAELHHLDQSRSFVRKLEIQRQQLEAQLAYEEINSQAKVTPEDVQQYYTAHAADYDEISLRQFVVRKKAAALTDPAHPAAPTTPGLPPEEAKKRADAIRAEVTAGTDIKKIIEDFKAPGDVIIEADTRQVRHGGMRPEMEKVAFALKDGQVSDTFDVPQAIVFLQVTKHSHAEFKNVAPEIEKNLRQQKVDAELNAVKKNAAVWMDDQYFTAGTKPADKPTMGPPPGTVQPK